MMTRMVYLTILNCSTQVMDAALVDDKLTPAKVVAFFFAKGKNDVSKKMGKYLGEWNE